MKLCCLTVLTGFCLLSSFGPTSGSGYKVPPPPDSEDDNEYNIYDINQQIEKEELESRGLRRSSECPTTPCYDECMLGREIGADGCPMCGKCKTKGMLESDIVVDESNYDLTSAIYGRKTCEKSQRGAARDPRRKWPKNGRTVDIPFTVANDVSKEKGDAIIQAMEEYHMKTCIKFVPKPQGHTSTYINFVGDDRRGCSSFVGRIQRGKQDITIGRNCHKRLGTIIHEIMHALGFFHEQSRGDRDSYVRVIEENILPNAKNNFQKRPASEWDPLGSPYDTGSVMHYGGYYFSNGETYGTNPTIIDRSTNRPVVAQRRGFSVEDLKQVNAKYECGGHVTGKVAISFGTSTGGSSEQCKDKSERCKEFVQHCNNNQDFRDYCPESCGACQEKTDCQDEESTNDCQYWKSQQFCERHEHVRQRCEKTCGVCGGTTRPTTRPITTRPTTPQTTPPPTQCRDLQASCSEWKRQNFCVERHVAHMKKYCRKTCGFCSSALLPRCSNENKHCDSWAKKGYCNDDNEYRDYLRKNCKLSCRNHGIPNLCRLTVQPVITKPTPTRFTTAAPQTTPTAAPQTTPTASACTNSHQDCDHWASQGHCDSTGAFRQYMRKNCRKACKLCITATTTPPPIIEYNGRCGVPDQNLEYRMLQRIVGGRSAVYGAIPWMASILRNGRDFCGGALINRRYIVTAAHCFYNNNRYIGNTNQMDAYLGKHHRRTDDVGQLRVKFSSIMVHDRYNHTTSDYDIALIKLTTRVRYSQYIRPVCLAPANLNVREGDVGLVSGWGDQRSSRPRDELQQVDVEIVKRRTCNTWLGRYNNRRNEVTRNMFCAGYKDGGKDACQGDSGSPLTVKHNGRHNLFGLVSWGYGCANRGRPGVYTKIPVMLSWIRTNIRR